ncbi:DivIVA domain-containing protein [bacterium]|nr:DivIVA domain-containing protein [bacterium]
MLSPVEIKKQEFGRSVRGYDTAEVRSFLETVAEDFETLSNKVNSNIAEIKALQTELITYQRIEQNMKEALVNAQETLRDAKEGSKKEVDLMRREAELEAEKIINAANKQGEAIRREVSMLSERRDSFVRKLKNLLRTELELIQLLENEDINNNKNKQDDGK